jgi:hypothetical protein
MASAAIPVIGTVVSGILGFFQNKGQNDAEKQARDLFNQYLQGHTDAFNKMVELAKAHGYDPFGPQVTTTGGTSTSTGGSTSRTHGVTDTTQVVDPAQAAMKAKLESLIMGLLGTPEQVTEGEKAAMLEKIGQGQRASEAKIGNAVSGMNLGGGSLQSVMLANPAANAANAQRAQYLGSEVPQENRALATQARNEAAGLMNAWKGGHQVSDTTGSGTTWSSGTGSSTTTAPPNYASLFSMMAPTAPQAGGTGYNPYVSSGSSLLKALMDLYANGGLGGGQG